METKFKTNIKCSACVAKVSPILNRAIGENQWNVDLADPQRTLTAKHDVDQSKVNAELKGIGYWIERVWPAL